MKERHLLLSRAHELNAQKTIIQLNLIEKGKKGETSFSPHSHTHTHTHRQRNGMRTNVNNNFRTLSRSL